MASASAAAMNLPWLGDRLPSMCAASAFCRPALRANAKQHAPGFASGCLPLFCIAFQWGQSGTRVQVSQSTDSTATARASAGNDFSALHLIRQHDQLRFPMRCWPCHWHAVATGQRAFQSGIELARPRSRVPRPPSHPLGAQTCAHYP